MDAVVCVAGSGVVAMGHLRNAVVAGITKTARSRGRRLATFRASTPGVPTRKEPESNILATMESTLKRVHDSAAYKDDSERNIFEDNNPGSTDFGR